MLSPIHCTGSPPWWSLRPCRPRRSSGSSWWRTAASSGAHLPRGVGSSWRVCPPRAPRRWRPPAAASPCPGHGRWPTGTTPRAAAPGRAAGTRRRHPSSVPIPTSLWSSRQQGTPHKKKHTGRMRTGGEHAGGRRTPTSRGARTSAEVSAPPSITQGTNRFQRAPLRSVQLSGSFSVTKK